MANTTHTIGSTGITKKLVDLGDGTYADAVVVYGTSGGGQVAAAELVLAKGTGSTGGLGKVHTVPDDGWLYVRCDTSDDTCSAVDFRVQSTKIHDVQLYKARSVVDSVTLTVAALADTETIFIQGLTYTAEETANTATYDAREFSVAGNNDADAAALAALINADYSVVTAGTSAAATDHLHITTDEGIHVIAAAATADYPAGKYGLNVTAATELASIVLAINHKGSVTCVANPDVGDTVTVGGQVYTFATVEDTVTHAPTRVGTADAIGTSLAACVNADTTGQTAHGISASNTTGVVTFTRTTSTALGLASSNAVKLTVEQPGGVPGVIAAATPGTATKAELSITPTWTEVLTVTAAGTKLTVTDIDCPGVLATVGTNVVTLTPGTPAGTSGEMATVIHAVTGTAAGNCVVSQAATLAGLMTPPDITSTYANVAANSTTAGALYTLPTGGYEQCYLAVMNDSGDASVATIVVGATKRI
jgi:hypothetical protein